MSETTLGAVFLPQFTPAQLHAAAHAADESGLEQLWLWEDCFCYSGIAAAGGILGATERLHVGIGLLPVPLRNVAITAMEIATLERLFPGRVRAGLGHGVLDWMRQVGAGVESPMTLLREQLTALRALLAGESVTSDARYVHLDAVQLDPAPSTAPPLYVGAQGPRTLRLAGELGDGTILSGGITPDLVRSARESIAAGAAAGARTGPHDVVVYLIAVTGPNARRRMAACVEHWNLDATQDVAIAGDAAEIADAIGRWTQAGATTVVLQPTEDEPDPAAYVRFVAEQVRPLVP